MGWRVLSVGPTQLNSIPTHQSMRLALLPLIIASLTGVSLSAAVSPNGELLYSRSKWEWQNPCKEEYTVCTLSSQCCYKNCSSDGFCEVSGR